MGKGGYDIHIRLLGGLVKATPHLFAIDGNGGRIFSPGRKVGTKLVKKSLKARRFHQAEEPRIRVMAGDTVGQFKVFSQKILAVPQGVV